MAIDIEIYIFPFPCYKQLLERKLVHLQFLFLLYNVIHTNILIKKKTLYTSFVVQLCAILLESSKNLTIARPLCFVDSLTI